MTAADTEIRDETEVVAGWRAERLAMAG